MQIDRLNHLLFPPDSAGNSASSNKDAAAGATAAGGLAHARTKAPAVVHRATPAPAGVVLKIQSTLATSVQAGADGSPVYTDQRKNSVADSSEREAEHMAQGHQSAMERNAGVFTHMSVDKDGVLVAKPRSASGEHSTDFVTIAVSAMRLHADEQERLKKGSAEANDPPTDAPAGMLRSFQQLAARFNVFA